jgi:hypothetical protein
MAVMDAPALDMNKGKAAYAAKDVWQWIHGMSSGPCLCGGSGGMNVYIRDGPVRRNIQG